MLHKGFVIQLAGRLGIVFALVDLVYVSFTFTTFSIYCTGLI